MDIIKLTCPRYPSCPYGSQCVFSHPKAKPKPIVRKDEVPKVVDRIVRRPLNKVSDATDGPPLKKPRLKTSTSQKSPESNTTWTSVEDKTTKPTSSKFYLRGAPRQPSRPSTDTTTSIESIRGAPGTRFKPPPPKPEPEFLPLPCDSPISKKIRVSVLNVLRKEFLRVYSAMPADLSRYMSTQDTLNQELEIAKRSLDDRTYKSEAAGVLTLLKKRPIAKDKNDVGTFADLNKRASEKPTPYVTLEQLNPLMHSLDKLQQHEYMTSIPAFMKDLPDDMVSQHVLCERCNSTYVVQSDETKRRPCNWHPERLVKAFNPAINERTRIYACCQEPQDSKGCKVGTHVFKIDAVEQLHRLIPYIDSSKAIGNCDILALDCEMSYTTLGMEMTRVSVLDAFGETVLDKLVRPYGAVLDLNTQWSGVVSLDGVPMNQTLDKVRQELLDLMHPKTILIGHGFENDLKALRLVHNRIVDTAILIPNPTGSLYKPALRRLCAHHLGKFIQQDAGGQAEGHDSVEDSKACLELLKWFVNSKRR